VVGWVCSPPRVHSCCGGPRAVVGREYTGGS
jgi:hypothetical protein